MNKKTMKIVYWLPRIMSIIFILFLAMFSLDVFGNGYSLWETIVGLFMHNILSMILSVIVIISWKHELVGAIGFTLAGIAYIAMLGVSAIANNQFEYYMIAWALQIAGPAFLVGALFLVNWQQKRKKTK